MFTETAELYDLFFEWKDYAGEAEKLHELIQSRSPGAGSLLDVACGTGRHLEHLRAWYEVEGVSHGSTISTLPGATCRAMAAMDERRASGVCT